MWLPMAPAGLVLVALFLPRPSPPLSIDDGWAATSHACVASSLRSPGSPEKEIKVGAGKIKPERARAGGGA
jgi:hypothetical protein